MPTRDMYLQAPPCVVFMNRFIGGEKRLDFTLVGPLEVSHVAVLCRSDDRPS